jgi:NADPH2:quinone reductase
MYRRPVTAGGAVLLRWRLGATNRSWAAKKRLARKNGGESVKVVQFSAYGGPEVLEVAEVPDPQPSDGEVRLRIRAAAVNPADTKWRAGMFQGMADIALPHVVGYDVAGEVDAIGNGVANLSVGDRVLAKLDSLKKGGYAELAVIPAGDAVPVPVGLDFATAAAVPTAGLTGTQMVEQYAQPGTGDLVLVTGAVGAVGRFAVRAARARGAKVIAAVREAQVEEARALGADEVIVLGATGWTGEAFDVVLDTVGGRAVGQLCQHLKPGGRIFTAATTPIEAGSLPAEPVFVMVQSDVAKLADLARAVAAGEIPVPVARRFPLDQAAEAHRLVEAGGTGGKIILEP